MSQLPPRDPTLDHSAGILEFGQAAAVLGGNPGERNERKVSLDLAKSLRE